MKRIHTRSVRLADGAEALLTRVVDDGRIGYGFSLQLDATASRHMAEGNVGAVGKQKRPLPPELEKMAATVQWEDK